MKKCGVFACPSQGARLYPIDLGTNVWLCEDCINEAERLVRKEAQQVRKEAQKQKELVRAG
ncbi:MAG: hypothetical protein BZY75_06270 [SAR202 cluster bacterium Io17-Chloro-G7]|nr:MAG: hypothetical protein BZY75_06270 [SAR202 cluster bacterium Io17-Chloro-G7]